MQGQQLEITNIRDLKIGMKNVNVIFIVLEAVGRPNTTKDRHEVRTFKVADRTACINISIWDEPGVYIQSGDICKLTKGYASLWKGCLTLYTGKGGEIQKIGEFCMTFTEVPNMSEPNPEYIQQLQAKLNIQSGGERGSPTPPNQPTPPALSVPALQNQGNNPTQPPNLAGNGYHPGPPFSQRNRPPSYAGPLGPNPRPPLPPSANQNTNGHNNNGGNNNNNNNNNNKQRINRR